MPDEFTIRWEIDNINKLNFVPRVSPIVRHFNIPWRLLVQMEKKRTENQEHMGLFLCCNHESTCELWSCEHSSQLIVCNRKEEKNLTKTISCIFGKGQTDWGKPGMIEFATLLRPSDGFVKDNKVVVEARVSVTKLQFLRRDTPEIDFAQPTLSADNVTLKLKDGVVNVCRRYLMWHSTYFASLFSENSKEYYNELLADTSSKDFTNLLDVIYPSEKPIRYDTYKPILKLAKIFQIERALDLVETYLSTAATFINTSEKLLLAEEHNLELLKAHCFESITTLEDMKKLEAQTAFSRLSAPLKVSLLKQAFEMIE